MKFIPAIALIMSTAFLSACSSFFEKDNIPTPTPLKSFQAEVTPKQVWSTQAGSGSQQSWLKMTPAIDDTAIYTTSLPGTITAISKANGQRLWQTDSKLSLTTGPAVNSQVLVAGSRFGDIIALNKADGHVLWHKHIKGVILANPAIKDQVVMVKTLDGYVHAFNTTNGESLWVYQKTEPNLILRGSSSPIIDGKAVLVGFASGDLAKLRIINGQLLWNQPVAFPEGAFAVQRMIDIDANPLVEGHRIFVGTYQGKLSALDNRTGRSLWSHEISTYTGLASDANAVYLSDAIGDVWSFTAESGLVNWRQTNLAARTLSPPAFMQGFVVVGDAEGYIHWLDSKDGHLAGRSYVGGGVYAKPIVDQDRLYVFTQKGKIIAFTITRR